MNTEAENTNAHLAASNAQEVCGETDRTASPDGEAESRVLCGLGSRVLCGLGCACLTDCGDYYASHGLPKPPNE